jgi:GT2 family glycosyltransferase
MVIIYNLLNFFIIKLILLVNILTKILQRVEKRYFKVFINKRNFEKLFSPRYLISTIEHLNEIKDNKKKRTLIMDLLQYHLRKIMDILLSKPPKIATQYLIHHLIQENSIEVLKKKKLKKSEISLKISIVMPVFNTNLVFLKKAVGSVIDQIYPNWELCIVGDYSTNQQMTQYLRDISKSDKKIKVFFSKKKLGIANATNKAIEMAMSKWIAFLDPNDLLSLDALLVITQTIKKNKKTCLIYSDEAKVNSEGNNFHSPYFKPDWNYNLFLSSNYICHLLVIRKELILEVGGLSSLHDGTQDYDLILKCIERLKSFSIFHIDKILYYSRAYELSTATFIASKNYTIKAGVRAIQDHYQRIKIKAKVKALAYGYRTRYQLPNKKPAVTLIIPSRNKVDLLKTCISSILKKTTYPNYDIIIIDNNSDCDETLRYLNFIQKAHKTIKVIPYKKNFNYSAINNFAVKQTKSEIVGFVNNDVEIITPGWMEEMVQHAVRQDVGCVGAKLYYPNDTIQHAGITMGIRGAAGHSHRYFSRYDYGYFGRLKLVSEYSAVTAACLFIKKNLFKKVKGFDEKNLPVAFNDIDLNLKVNALNYKNIYTPFAELYHHESASRGLDDNLVKKKRALREIRYIKKKWNKVIRSDPHYNANLTLENENFDLRHYS